MSRIKETKNRSKKAKSRIFLKKTKILLISIVAGRGIIAGKPRRKTIRDCIGHRDSWAVYVLRKCMQKMEGYFFRLRRIAGIGWFWGFLRPAAAKDCSVEGGVGEGEIQKIKCGGGSTIVCNLHDAGVVEQTEDDEAVDWEDLPAELMCWCCNRRPVKAMLPVWVNPQRDQRIVHIDACIEPTIRRIWAAEIETLGCSCGHGKRPPAVVIGRQMSEAKIQTLQSILKTSDGRPWEIYQWKPTLVKVN